MGNVFEDLCESSDGPIPGIDQAVIVRVDNVFQYLARQSQGFLEVMAESPILIPSHPVMWFEYGAEDRFEGGYRETGEK